MQESQGQELDLKQPGSQKLFHWWDEFSWIYGPFLIAVSIPFHVLFRAVGNLRPINANFFRIVEAANAAKFGSQNRCLHALDRAIGVCSGLTFQGVSVSPCLRVSGEEREGPFTSWPKCWVSQRTVAAPQDCSGLPAGFGLGCFQNGDCNIILP